MKKLLSFVSAMAFASLSAMAGVDITFADGQLPTGYTNSAGEAEVINGNLHVEMAIQNNGSYRSDIKFDASAGITLNPSTDLYLAIKFNGTAPDGKMSLEFNDGKWYNSKWNSNANRSSITDSNKNTVYYFNLNVDDSYTGEETLSINVLNLKIADNTKMQNYSVDWIKTFASVDDITAYKDAQDDGTDDYAVWNETLEKGYGNVLTAITEATASGENCTLIVRQNSIIAGSRATVSATELTVQGSDPRITITRNSDNMFFLNNNTSAKLYVKDLTIDGQNQTGKRMIEANNSCGGILLDNITFRNSCGNQTGAAVFIQRNVTIKDCKFINITSDNSGADKGVIFMGGNGLKLQGDNTFEKCGINIYNEANYDFTNDGTSHTTPINITIDPAKKLVGGKVVGNCHEPWKYVLNNEGYCLLYNGKDNHLYLAEGYAANVSELGYATFYGDDAMDLTIPSGVEAYVCKVNEAKEYATLIQIEDVIPSGTAVLLYSENPMLYQFVKSTESAAAITDNDMQGSNTAVELNGADADYYLLTSEGSNPVFKHVGAATTVTSAAHKAYIRLDKVASRAPALRIRKGGETSGISNVTINSEDSEATYNVFGQQVDYNYRGIVIRNGKKQMQK